MNNTDYVVTMKYSANILQAHTLWHGYTMKILPPHPRAEKNKSCHTPRTAQEQPEEHDKERPPGF